MAVPPSAPQSRPAQPTQPERATSHTTVAQSPTIPVTKPAAAPARIWVTNDPAQVFKAPSWSVAIAPLWAKVQALPQLPPRTQLWGLNKSTIPTAPQPSTGNVSKQILTAESVSSHPPATHHATGPSIPAATKVAQVSSTENSIQAVVGLLASLHVSEPTTWAWSEPSIFGQYMDKDKTSVFQVGLANAANTRLPGGDLGGGLREIKPMQATQKAAVVPPKRAVQDKEPQALSSIAADTRLPGSGSHGDQNDIEPQQDTQKAAIAQRLGELPTAEANGSFSSIPNAVTEKQPSGALGAQEKSAGTSPVGQTQVSFPDTTQTTTAMGAEEPQPTDKGNDVAVQGQFNLSTSTFRLETVPQHFAQVNNPFLNAATPPASNGPTTVQQLGSQEPVSEASTANGVASQEQAYEVGSDDDPNVDVNFDFGKHFKRTAAPGAGVSSTPPASTASAALPTEGSPLAEAPATSEASPAAEITPPAQAPLPPIAPAGPIAQASAPVSAASFPFTAPPPPPTGFEFSAAGPPSKPKGNPRGKNKRRRDRETECMCDEDDAHYTKTIVYWHPGLMMTMGHQYERRRALLAALKAKPHVTYDEEYAMNMMDEMFYEILPRLASELLFPTPKCKLADQEDEAKCFVDSMLEDELNEKSFDLVQEAYEPRFGVKFRLWREHLFDIFSDWYLKILSPALPDLVHNMTLDEIKDLSEILWDNIWKYMDDHPPRNKL